MRANDNTCPSPTTNDDLCEACQKINFDALMEVDISETNDLDGETIVWSLGPQPYRVLEESARSCKLCQFFVESFEDLTGDSISKDAIHEPIMVSLGMAGSFDWSLYTMGFSPTGLQMKDYSRPHFNLEFQYQETKTYQNERPCLKDRIQFCRRPGTDRTVIRFRPPTPQVPFDLIRGWLDFCKCHHGPDCSEGEVTNNSSLRVIDCKATPRRVVSFLPELGSYAALSYVWGVSSPAIDTHSLLAPEELPSLLPRSIEDAITVALALGFQYLWVDQYCIPQDDEDERARQIQFMDEIYHGAELTIIAAAGKDADYGLPRVSSTPRKLLRSVQIGVDTLVYVPEHTFSLSRQAAAWLRRGWTYQEGILSRRRLLFMDHQVYFQCAGMSVWEAMDVSLDVLHCEGSRHRKAKTFVKDFRIESLTQKRGVVPIDDNIASYFSTELSRPEDAIQAISGIFSHWNKIGNCQFLVLSGLPLYLPLGSPIDSDLTALDLAPALLRALAWYHKFSPFLKRREIFPSWTWAGWQEVDKAANDGYRRASFKALAGKMHAAPTVQVGILSKDGDSKVLWTEVHELPWQQSRSQLVAQYIALTGWTFKATVSETKKQPSGSFKFHEVDGFTVTFPDITLAKSELALHRGAPGLESGTELVAMLLYWDVNFSVWQAEMPILLLCPTSRKIDSRIVYERVGLAKCWIHDKPLTADHQQLPSWVCGVFQTVYIG
ncbi:HET-domain-containing protein [Stipitochalara longipes BDJ]|nr:HET-domain-containing protein [Stipitochalara longipes BDJ]